MYLINKVGKKIFVRTVLKSNWKIIEANLIQKSNRTTSHNWLKQSLQREKVINTLSTWKLSELRFTVRIVLQKVCFFGTNCINLKMTNRTCLLSWVFILKEKEEYELEWGKRKDGFGDRTLLARLTLQITNNRWCAWFLISDARWE